MKRLPVIVEVSVEVKAKATVLVAVSALFCGADSQSRTGDLLITNQTLYQLSYVGLTFQNSTEDLHRLLS